jgi:uncharacterized protein YqjF (DUF2071 family)
MAGECNDNDIMNTSRSRTAGYQRWQKLLFIHWRMPLEQLQPLVPDQLAIESFDGSAWLGVVPFSMERIRPWWSPPVPGISWFLETNVRTYVVDRRGVRGVWFFSLDANKQLAVSVARRFWHLPYQMAKMTLMTEVKSSSSGQLKVSYVGRRTDSPPAEYRISANVSLSVPPVPAAPGTLDHFLVERYLLFSQSRNGTLMTGRVHHEPYQLRTVHGVEAAQTLTAAIGCPVASKQPPDHVAYSDGVDVRVSPLARDAH